MNQDALKRLASRYIWWKSPEDALRYPNRILAQVMDLGDFDDVMSLFELFGEERLRDVLRQAEPGQFSPKSWAYWHYRLGLASTERLPDLPQRRVA